MQAILSLIVNNRIFAINHGGVYFIATLLGTLPAHFVFAYSADALFSGTMTERDALKHLAIVAALLIALALIPTVIKRLTKRADAVRPYR